MRKHGGEKGVPFRIQIDTFKENEGGEYTEHLHSASCQVKVFKVRGGSWWHDGPSESGRHSGWSQMGPALLPSGSLGCESGLFCLSCAQDMLGIDWSWDGALRFAFQPKGADRKQKTDREKMEKRAPQEKEKYQPSYETTILTEV